MPSFNLVDRGWIPCTRTDGEVGEYGLEYVLSQAHDILEISAPSPLVTVAVHRLLLAILHRNFGPRDMAHWSELWQKKRWDSERLSSYFGDWHDRFDLFHPQRPFYQVLEMQDTRRHPATLLALEAASLNNATLFDHSVDEDRKPLQASEAARYLVARQSFSIGGGKSKPFNLSDSPLIRGVNVLALGDNLFETLALNLLPYSSDYPIPGTAQDAPAWEQNEPRQPDREGSVPYGYLDYLTWQSRRIHLFPERGSDQIRTCQIQQNLKLGESTVVDPFKCYTVPKDKKRGREELGLSSERAMWRDSHALFQEVPGQSSRPELANWLARVERVRRDGEIEARAGYRISLAGIATERGKAAGVILWRQERLPLPLAYLDDRQLAIELRDALRFAEKVGQLFLSRYECPLQKMAVTLLSLEGGRKPNQDDVDRLVRHLGSRRVYWSKLEVHFHRLISELPHDATQDQYGQWSTAKAEWCKSVRRAAQQAMEEVTRSLDRSGRSLKAAAVGNRYFSVRLNEATKRYLGDGGDK